MSARTEIIKNVGKSESCMVVRCTESLPQAILQSFVGVAYQQFDPAAPGINFWLSLSVGLSLLNVGYTCFCLEAMGRRECSGGAGHLSRQNPCMTEICIQFLMVDARRGHGCRRADLPIRNDHIDVADATGYGAGAVVRAGRLRTRAGCRSVPCGSGARYWASLRRTDGQGRLKADR